MNVLSHRIKKQRAHHSVKKKENNASRMFSPGGSKQLLLFILLERKYICGLTTSELKKPKERIRVQSDAEDAQRSAVMPGSQIL